MFYLITSSIDILVHISVINGNFAHKLKDLPLLVLKLVVDVVSSFGKVWHLPMVVCKLAELVDSLGRYES